MKDQVIMSPQNGSLAVAVPLFRLQSSEPLTNLDGYSMIISNEKPCAYAVDAGPAGIVIWNAEFVESKLINLGEL